MSEQPTEPPESQTTEPPESQTTEPPESQTRGFATPEQEQIAKELAGFTGVYRLGFRSMFVDGMPERVAFAGAVFLYTTEPVITNRTTIIQQPGLALAWRKRREENVELARDVPKCICHVPFELSDTLPIDLSAMRERALTATGLLVALLDERVALSELFEDALVIDPESDGPATPVDRARHVRQYTPRVFSKAEEEVTASHQETFSPPEVQVAARWYLQGAQAGPVPDAIVSFWIAIEGLVDAEGKRVVKAVKEMLEVAGIDLRSLPMSVGRLYNLRADIVHKGLEDPDAVRSGYYPLEEVTRQLLRHRSGITSTWSANVSANEWPEPLHTLIEELRQRYRTFWEEA
jgi:hypothetical protein